MTKTYLRTTRRSIAKCETLNVPFNKRKTYGDHGFTHTAASDWNNLLEYIRLAANIRTFKKLLKTHYFRWAHNT